MNITELVREAGIYDGREGLMWCSKEQLERFAALVTAEKDKEIAELYEMSVKQAKTIKEYQDAEPVKQEPVAWMYDDGTSHKFIEPVLSVKRKDFPDGWRDSPLYAAPVDAKAIRAEALEEAAKVAESVVAKQSKHINDGKPFYANMYWEEIAAAIRGLK